MSKSKRGSTGASRLIRDNMRPDAPSAAAERVAYRAAGEQANCEMMARFAPLTAANAAEAIAWQEARIRELIGTSIALPPTMSERKGSITAKQVSYLRALYSEAVKATWNLRSGTALIGLDMAHLDQMSMASASIYIGVLKDAKSKNWP